MPAGTMCNVFRCNNRVAMEGFVGPGMRILEVFHDVYRGSGESGK
jgi:hypothetical protein